MRRAIIGGTLLTGSAFVPVGGAHATIPTPPAGAEAPKAAAHRDQAANGPVTGRVVDDKGEGLPGVNVIVRGTVSGTQTDATGAYSLANVPGDATLVFSYVGFASQELQLNGRTTIDVTLQSDTKALSEVVVVGYGTQRRADVTGSVASVSGTEIKSLPVTNVQEALQGRLAGVEVVKSSGAPDATASILIRGVSSLNNAQPLYIIDGVRQSGDNINIQDIASVDVLKDASAAAIYGSAAAGGVIIITTKKGKAGAPVINFSARYGITTPRTLKLLNRDDFIRLKQTIADPVYLGIEQTDTLPDTDWSKEIFRNGIEQNYNLSISGGSPNLSYLVSGIYNDQKGIYLNNRSSLAGARVNTDYQLGKRIKVGEQLYVWQRDTKPVTITPINPPFRTVPTMTPYTNDPANPYGRNPQGFAGPNLIAQIGTAHIDNKKANFQGNVFAEVALPLDLSFRTTFGYTYYTENQNYFQDSYNTGAVSAPINSLTKSNSTSTTLLNNYVLSYNHLFGQHSVSALVGYEQIKSVYDALRGSQNSVGGTSYAFLPTSASITRINPGGYDPNGLIKSTFARLNYGFNERYLFSLSARRDGNFTVFGPGNQYGVFPSASVGWRISEEPFVKSALPTMNQLKLRGSYGVLGNSNIPSYLFLSTYEFVNGQNFLPGAPPSLGYTQTLIPNPNIKWESVYESNVGLDAEFLSGRFFFTVEWYNKTTKDMLYALPIPTSVGIPTRFYTNIGSVRNRGVDLVLGTRAKAGDFNYSASLTGSFNKNRVLNLDNINSNPIQAGDNNYGSPTFGQQTGQFLTYTRAGLPFGQFYGYETEGIYQTQEQVDAHPQRAGTKATIGDLIYRDVNGDGLISDLDKTTIGNPNPELVYGLNLNLSWKGFDLALLFNGVAGVDLYNGVAPYAQFPFSDGNTTARVFGASFLGDNGLTEQPRIGVLTPGVNGAPATFATDPNGNYANVSSYFVEKGDYVKLKNLQLGYNFGGSLLQRAQIKNARLYVMANNLFTITSYSGVDPEIGGDVTLRGIDAPLRYPNARIYSLGVDLTF
ncbi:SusC/RagA family TonB-linked outer membrane protein [uncultured Hymenobacter sp.]|uniref:SusC/RagA family TonB-linked outer membrane protein n=1 Tax=uncultured Hymenobacter sp. TaxID=170016 RepID=UPI0035CC3C62